MNIPFIRFFKKDRAEDGSVAVAPRPVATNEKPVSERLGKTVLPNSSRIVGLEPSGNFPLPPPASSPAQTIPAVTRKISLGGNGSIAVGPKLSPSGSAGERTIALSLADLVPNIPSDLLKPAPVDSERRVLLQASEVERGMSTGRPTVLLRVIYKQAPEFFTSEVPAADLREVALPFAKVVEQFANFQVRDDQITDQECPQLETPFLQVTLEDNARFGKSATPPAGREIPTVKLAPVAAAKPAIAAEAKPAIAAEVKPAIAAEAKPAIAAEVKPAIAAEAKLAIAAEAKPIVAPESKLAIAAETKPATVAETKPTVPAEAKPAVVAPVPPVASAPKAIAPIKFTAPPPAPAPASASAPALAPVPAVKAPLPLDQLPPSPPTAAKISPNGTGAPAAERVPASSGSPVPTPLPSPLAPLPPTRIPFKITPPSNDLRTESKFPAPRANPDAAEFASSGPRISLPLLNILRNLAPFQLSGPIDAVPESAQIEIPFSIVQPQLSLGRVAISPAQFQAALPEEHRALFVVDAAGSPVSLSLQDVLQNLPSESLQLRGDQEEPEVTDAFETPFSQKASEDAARMKVSAGPIAKTTAGATVAAPQPVAATPEAAAPKPAATTVKPAVAAVEPTPPPAPAPAEPVARVAATPPREVPIESAKAAPVELPRETPELASAPKAEAAPAPKPTTAPAPSATGIRTSLQNLLDTDEPLDAKSVVGHVSRLPGVSSCAIVFSDGLSLAGNIPADYEADALCAMAPSILKRIGEQMVGAKFGALNSLTLFCGTTPISLFAHGNICLAAIHSGGEIAPEVRDRLGRTAQELARMYAQAA